MNSSSSISRPTAGKDLDLEIFLFRFLDLVIHHEVPELFCQQELRLKLRFLDDLSRGSALTLLKRASWSAVKKLDCHTYNWRFLLLDIAFGVGCRCS